MKTICCMLLLPAAINACTNQSGTPEQGTVTDTSTRKIAPTVEAQEKQDNNAVAFKVNGVAASTTKAAPSDNDEDLGMLMAQNMELGLDLHGDDPAKPHRGWLHFTIQNFKLQPGTYTATGENSVRFTRYETANAGGSVDYYASAQPLYKGSSMTIEFTSIEKNTAPGYEKEYIASGKFSSALSLGEFSKNDTKKVDITEGSFEHIRITVLGQVKP